MSMYSLAFDLVAVAVLCLCAVCYARRGFVAGAFSFFGTLIAILCAGLAAYYLSPAIFSSFFRSGMVNRVSDTIAEKGITDIDHLLDALISFIPAELREAMVVQMDLALDFNAPDIASLVVDQVVAPILIPFIMLVVFFVLFSLARVLVGVLRSVATGLNKVPVMGAVNRALGAVAGIFIGALYIYLGLCVLWAYDSLNPQNSMAQQYFQNSLLLKLLSPFNFFTKI